MRYFLRIGSQGFDALVTQRVNFRRKWFKGPVYYLINAIRIVFTWKIFEVKVSLDNQKYIGKANCITVDNGPSYGGFMYICHLANLHDDLFNISIVNIGNARLLYEFSHLYISNLLPFKSVIDVQSKNVRFEMNHSADSPYICQVDSGNYRKFTNHINLFERLF